MKENPGAMDIRYYVGHYKFKKKCLPKSDFLFVIKKTG